MIEVHVGELPIWLGAQTTPEIERAPFAFAIDDTGLVRLANNEVMSRMVEAYARDDYHFITSPPGSSDYGNRLAERSIRGLLTTVDEVAGRDILELGGGTLHVAETLVRRYGARSVTIIDPALQRSSELPQVSVRSEYFDQSTPVENPVSLILAINTLEHVERPLEFLRAMRQHLTDDGLIYLKVPDSEESLSVGDLGVCVHEHLSYFSMKSLATLLRRAGLRLAGHANYRGALQVVAEKDEVDAGARTETKEHLLQEFVRQARKHAEEVRRRVEAGPTAFVGASVGLANVLDFAGVRDAESFAIFDGDDLKEGRFLPGVDQPIRLLSDPAFESFECYSIVPINFYDEIREQVLERTRSGAEVLPVFPIRHRVP